ncbi:MAG: exo-alpha-sialidase [Candidatus Binataceae bacterium]|nr:exo-alpha-sialidase [Candidatus Binataceae bacterium]
MPLRLFRKIGLFSKDDIQVTYGTPKQARSESVIAINPRDRNNLIAASKKFSNPDTYRFTIGIRVSFDGGGSWQDATLPTLPEWGNMVGIGTFDAEAGMTDPAVVFDDFGNAFLVGEPIGYYSGFSSPNDLQTIGMFIYRSTDGGLHWNEPVPLHVGDLSDDKSWITCDNNPTSPHYGNIYIAWGAARSPLRFARSTDHGQSWKGIGNQASGDKIADQTNAPEISVGLDGTVHIVWNYDEKDATTIEYMRSINGGETFEAQKPIVTGIHGLRGNLKEVGRPGNQWPAFDGASFRVITLSTGCGFGFDPVDNNPFPIPFYFGPRNFIVAWSDFREGAARIYYRTSSNAGVSFEGPMNGQPLLGGSFVNHSLHHFHPQIVSTRSGVIGCAYYEYGPKNGTNLIDVKLSASFDRGKTFPYTTIVTDQPWDPTIHAPHPHSDSEVTFIGEYFGLDADDTGFDVLWTDTRTGVQELFYDRVETERDDVPEILGGISAQILFGIIQDGSGISFVNGHIIHVPPRGPDFELAQAMVALDAARKISGPAGLALTKSVYDAVASIAKAAGERSRG